VRPSQLASFPVKDDYAIQIYTGQRNWANYVMKKNTFFAALALFRILIFSFPPTLALFLSVFFHRLPLDFCLLSQQYGFLQGWP